MTDPQLIQRLVSKSEEAFMLALEIYNKPTIKYRVEGFSFFICNAWELLLKAHMINTLGSQSIYYTDKPERTFSLSKCLEILFSNQKDPLRLNLIKIIELRNTSTHFITDEYELIYMSLFQACVLNYSDKLMQYFSKDINEQVAQNFLTLSVNYQKIDDSQVKAKHSPEVAKRLLSTRDQIESNLMATISPNFSITINHNYFITKKKSDAEAIIAVDNTSPNPIKILKIIQDPNQVYKYSAKRALKVINSQLTRHHLSTINMWQFTHIVKYYHLKSNDIYTFTFEVGPNANHIYKYSYKAIEFIFNALEHDSELLKKLHKNKITPGAKEFSAIALLPFGNPALILHKLS